MPDAFRHQINSVKRFDIARSRLLKQAELGIHTGWKWARFKRMWMSDNPLCKQCGRLGEEVHHIVPRHVDPNRMYDVTNLMTLCHACHDEVHAQ